MFGRVLMSDEHLTRDPPIECRLVSTSMEIDDDDEDVIQVAIEVSNEAAMPIGGLEIFIQTSDNKKVESVEGISSLGPGLTRKFTFEFPLQKGNWTFMLRSPTVNADLGPYDSEFTFQAGKSRVYNNAIGTGMFTDAFSGDLGDFGNVEERGLIDASSIKMTSYYGENSAGGSTTITAGRIKPDSKSTEDAPRIPPWEKGNDPLLNTPAPVSTKPTPTAENPEPAADLLAFSKQVGTSSDEISEVPIISDTPPLTPDQLQDEVAEEPIIASTPPSLPPTRPPSQPPSSPPSGPPSQPPSSPPSGPPSKPPSGPPSGPPTKPPSGPPSQPPSSPPSGPPSKPPSGPPSQPPSGPPTGPPSKPPTGPPSGPPSGPPKSKKPTRPPM